jgi:hypothetical protein
MSASQNRPLDARKFVGEGLREQIAMRHAFGRALDPWPKCSLRGYWLLHQNNVGPMNEMMSELAVAALREPGELGTAAGRYRPGHQSELDAPPFSANDKALSAAGPCH